MARLSNRKDGRLTDLQSKEYISGWLIDEVYERNVIKITLKGLLALLLELKDFDRKEYCSIIYQLFDLNLIALIKPPPIHFYRVDFWKELDYFFLQVKMLIPVKPVAILWVRYIESEYRDYDLDSVYLENIHRIFLDITESVMHIIHDV